MSHVDMDMDCLHVSMSTCGYGQLVSTCLHVSPCLHVFMDVELLHVSCGYG